MIKNNYHTHLLYCNHAVGHAEDYIQEALKHGFSELGITDHAPILECFMNRKEFEDNWCDRLMKIDVMYQNYLPELEAAKKRYQDQIRILSGFETEYLPQSVFFVQLLRSKVDYLNLGVHFFDYQNKVLNSYDDVNTETIYGYLEACVEGMKTGLYNVLVHPDLFMFNYHNKENKRVFDEHCEAVSRKIIETAIEFDVYLEINANGIKNSILFSDDKGWLYPDRQFWKIAKEYPRLKILIGADAHDPKHLAGKSVEQVCQFAESLNLKIESKMEINH